MSSTRRRTSTSSCSRTLSHQVRNENPRLANLAVLGSCVRGHGEHSLTPYNPFTLGGLYVGLLGGSPNTQTSIEYGGTPVCPASNLGIFGETRPSTSWRSLRMRPVLMTS